MSRITRLHIIYFVAGLVVFFIRKEISVVLLCVVFVYLWLQSAEDFVHKDSVRKKETLNEERKIQSRLSYLKWLLLLIFSFLIGRSYLGFVFLLMIPFGAVFDPWRFSLFCILFSFYFVFVRRGFFKKRQWTFLRCGAVLWSIGFLSAFHMYFLGDLSQCPKDDKISGHEVAPVLTSKICSRNKLYLGEWDECHEDLGTTHALYVDTKTSRIFTPHMGSKKQVPVCVFHPSNPVDHKFLKLRGSVHHLAVDIKRRRMFLPLMSDNRVLVVNMDALNTIKVLKPTAKSSLIDIVMDDLKDEIFILSEYSEIVRVSLKTGKMKRLSLHAYSPGALYALALNKKTRRIYVSSWIGGRIVKIHADTLKVEKVKHQSMSVMGLQVDEKQNVLYVSLPFSSTILALDGSTLKEIRRYPAGLGVRDIAYLENAGMLMAGNYLRRTVDFVDLLTGEKIRSFYVGPMVRGVYYDAKRFEAYSVGRCGIYRFNVRVFSSVP